MQDYSRDALHRRHRHVSSEDRDELLRNDFVEWLSKTRGVLRFTERFSRFQLSLHGASSRYGVFLANAIRHREGWALVVREEMNNRGGQK
jgi:hypothetical protein